MQFAFRIILSHAILRLRRVQAARLRPPRHRRRTHGQAELRRRMHHARRRARRERRRVGTVAQNVVEQPPWPR